MKIFVLSPNENWILDRVATEWQQLNPDMTTTNIQEADVIWLLSSWQWRSIPAELLNKKKTIATVHHVVKEKFTKGTLREFLSRDVYIDAYHVPCQKTKDFISKITKKPIYVVGYWYNPDYWYPTDKEQSRAELGIPNDQFVVGSFQRDTEGGDLKSPKLEKGPDLFIESIKRVKKENLLVLLGGWRRQYVIERLEKEGIEYKFIEMAPIDTLRKMYAACDLYIVSSRCEGGPQALLESSTMRVPIISRDVGMADVVLAKNCVLNDEDEMYYPTDKDVEENFIKTQEYSIQNQIKKYEKMFREL